jgi:hypothetical protein
MAFYQGKDRRMEAFTIIPKSKTKPRTESPGPRPASRSPRGAPTAATPDSLAAPGNRIPPRIRSSRQYVVRPIHFDRAAG